MRGLASSATLLPPQWRLVCCVDRLSPQPFAAVYIFQRRPFNERTYTACANVAASLNHLIRPLQKRLRDGQTERLRGLRLITSSNLVRRHNWATAGKLWSEKS